MKKELKQALNELIDNLSDSDIVDYSCKISRDKLIRFDGYKGFKLYNTVTAVIKINSGAQDETVAELLESAYLDIDNDLKELLTRDYHLKGK